MKEAVEEILEEIRPRLAMHRGNVELVDVNEETGVVRVRFQGTCQGCPLSHMTLKMGIEALLTERLPQVSEVVAVT